MEYIDRAANEMVLYLDELQRPNGLFHHAPDVPFYWGRGNGWMAAGITELLRHLPKDHKDRPRVLNETSGSAMFTYALITGVKKGWLDKQEYAAVARKAWMALVPYINEKGDVTEVCVGTNKKNDKQYYYDRPRNIGDYHGQAPYLWCTFALLEK